MGGFVTQVILNFAWMKLTLQEKWMLSCKKSSNLNKSSPIVLWTLPPKLRGLQILTLIMSSNFTGIRKLIASGTLQVQKYEAFSFWTIDETRDKVTSMQNQIDESGVQIDSLTNITSQLTLAVADLLKKQLPIGPGMVQATPTQVFQTDGSSVMFLK